MNTDEKIKLWQYTELKPLSPKALLVRNNFDGRIMVRHLADKDSYCVFEKIQKLSSPYLMQVFDSTIEDNRCVSLCEYIDGVTLEKAVELRGKYSEKSVRNIMAQLCDGLNILHKNGIVHRDINPSNVMIDKNGIVKIIDYDILRTVKDGKSRDTQILGTPGYAAPEQFGFNQTDGRADIYSCGALMNYLLTGEIPSDKLYSGSLSGIIKKCLELDPENRFTDINELKNALLENIQFIKTDNKTRKVNHRRLPGFKTKNKVAEFFTILFLAVYFIMLFAYLNYSFNGGYDYNRTKGVFIGLTLFVFLTAVPYLSIGDIGGISRYIVKSRPSVGKLIMVLIGAVSLIIGIYLFCTVPSM